MESEGTLKKVPIDFSGFAETDPRGSIETSKQVRQERYRKKSMGTENQAIRPQVMVKLSFLYSHTFLMLGVEDNYVYRNCRRSWLGQKSY